MKIQPAYMQFSRVPLEDWLNGYKKNCKSEFDHLLDGCSRALTITRAKRIAEIKDSLSDVQKLALGISCE